MAKNETASTKNTTAKVGTTPVVQEPAKKAAPAIETVFKTLDEAKAYAAKMSAAYPKERFVYTCKTAGKPDVFIVAQSIVRARGHFAKYLELDVTRSEPSERKASKTFEERIGEMSLEEMAKIKEVLAAAEKAAAAKATKPVEKK